MEIKIVNRQDLSLSQERRVFVLLGELWDIEGVSTSSEILAEFGGPEALIWRALDNLEYLMLGYIDNVLAVMLGVNKVHPDFIDKLVVDSLYRRKGLGRCMVNAFKLLNNDSVWLTVANNNPGAVAFYTSMGFSIDKTPIITPLGNDLSITTFNKEINYHKASGDENVEQAS